jgi:alpha-galactosidase
MASIFLLAAGGLEGQSGSAPPPARTFTLIGHEVRVEGDLGSFELATDVRVLEPGVEVAVLVLRSPDAARPPRLSLRWSLPAHDVYGQWTSGSGFDKHVRPDWSPGGVRSMLARHAPTLCLFGADDGNRLTYAVSDALNTVTLEAGVREEDARIYAEIDLFAEGLRDVEELEVEIRFDGRDLPFHEALADVAEWWAARPGFAPAPVPEPALTPMYSTWYSYHQSVDAGALLREVEIARSMGYGAIIVDDGWQTLDSQRGYAFTGDWRPERIPEMRAFVDAVHDRGMRFLLWYSVPLVGERAEIFPEFQGRYLRYWEGQGAYVLDPRYPEVREHVVETYRRAVADWGVDGFKLDFLGFFSADDSTELVVADGRDFASVNEATDRLLTDIIAGLREVKPEVMIEFRQPYIGPLMRKYGNMFRAGDAPNAPVANRVRVVDLRLLSGSTAVHSDMFMWHYGDSVEAAARQFLNVLFSVPQLSVRLEDIPEEHREMVRHWTEYWSANRQVLLAGTFEPTSPRANYPLVSSRDDEKRIFAAYEDVRIPLTSTVATDAIDVVNAKASARIVLDVGAALGSYRYRVTDVTGTLVSSGTVDLGPGVTGFDVPASGLLALVRER